MTTCRSAATFCTRSAGRARSCCSSFARLNDATTIKGALQKLYAKLLRELADDEFLTRGNERDSQPFAPHSPCPPGTVHIMLRIHRRIVVDDEAQVLNVQPSGSYITSNEQLDAPFTESPKHQASSRLVCISIQGLCMKTYEVHFGFYFTNVLCIVNKHDGFRCIIGSDDTPQAINFLPFLSDKIHMFQRLGSTLLGFDSDLYRLLHLTVGQASDLRTYRCR
ncbi:hypothetical protein D3C72_760590 [compost metagenome]